LLFFSGDVGMGRRQCLLALWMASYNDTFSHLVSFPVYL
jgi:hypothetical protein